MKNYSDQQILKAVVSSIEKRDQAIRWLFMDTVFRNKAFGIIRKIIHSSLKEDENILFDIFDEGLIEFVRLVGLGKFQKKSSIHTYIIGICKFKAMEFNRRLKKQSFEVEALVDDSGIPKDIKSHSGSVEENYIEKESGMQAIVEQVIEKVSKRCQEILRRYLFDEQTIKTMAHELGTSIQTIKNARSKCRKELRNLIKNHPQTPEYLKKIE